MELERLSLAPAPVDDDTDAVPNGVSAGGGGDDGSRAPRLPRWTRQEILVLIQGKKVAESRVRRGRTGGLAFGGAAAAAPQIEPKWASVSSYCKRHGVNRGPVQCRKRWSNLAGDYKKIKEWESQIREESESFWVMRNDVRREKRLPGFFDREVYDMLDGVGAPLPPPSGLALGLAPEGMVALEEEAEAEAVFDSGRSAAAEDGLFSDFEQSGDSPEKEPPPKEAPVTVSAPVPISEKQYQSFPREGSSQGPANKREPPASNPEMPSTSQEGRKRKRFPVPAGEGDEDETVRMQDQLIEVLERNGRMLSAQLEAQNTNFQLDREQRKDQGDCLVAVLSKLADALGRIADKL